MTVLDSANDDPTTVGIYARVASEAVANATPTIVVQFVALDDGAAADPGDGAKLFLNLKLRNSSVS
jgi:hypothetical protein